MLRNLLRSILRRTGVNRGLKSLQKRFNYSKTITINTTKIITPTIYGKTCLLSELWMVELLEKLFQSCEGIFVDVGVNLGQTLIKVKALDSDREYIGFEPNPICVWYSSNLIKLNFFTNCTIFPVGLFTEDSVLSLDFFSDDDTDSSASLITNFREENKVFTKVNVPVFKFDSLSSFFENKVIGVVKIDVEGAELEVLQSIQELFYKEKPIVIIEILPVYSEDNAFRRARQEKIESLFMKAGYILLRVKKTTTNQYAGLSQIEQIGIHSNIDMCDYVAIHRQRLETLHDKLDISI